MYLNLIHVSLTSYRAVPLTHPHVGLYYGFSNYTVLGLPNNETSPKKNTLQIFKDLHIAESELTVCTSGSGSLVLTVRYSAS